MKTKLTITLAAVVLLVAYGVLNESHSKVINAKTSLASPEFNSEAAALLQFESEKNYGRIARVYPDTGGVYFRLGGKTTLSGKKLFRTDMNPVNGYYFIPIAHPNYKALVDLLYLCAEHDYLLYVRTEPALNSDGYAVVVYTYKDFDRS